MKALRFLTAGSVDDGKSTLIGRLLFDGQAILADQLDTLERRAAGRPIDLSLLTDGLEAEREQGITIDVAYRYFATKTRKFIIADAPGHEQYTRNMVTAAAGSDAAVVLVDITKLDLTQDEVVLLPQTRRHSLLAQLLRVPSIVFAINKIDALEDAGAGFAKVKAALDKFAAAAGLNVAATVPVSALRGDNVTQPLDAPWWNGESLLQVLERLPTLSERADAPLSLPVQYVQKDAYQSKGTGVQPRVLWGRIAHGAVKAGDTIEVLPSKQSAVVVEVRLAGETVPSAEAGDSAGLVLDRQLDVSRGDWIVTPGSAASTKTFPATLAWLDTEAAKPGRKYWVRHGNRWVQARISAIDSVLDINTLQPQDAHELPVNTIGRVQMEVQHELPVEPFVDNRVGGALIVVDPASHRTSGALLVDVQAAAPAEEAW
ncbi:sulfate adenylyltransferase subunit 1 [Pelomonas saccharophila]|uniref:sulfate adenylyltransferase n=1 Tax=Roseateles saccharophilus TaxID=304 RepID=A0ABU1YRQ9_ROSSA|nr:GTP-binding protein [Roseateles saccharophilus]MDR7271530.1 sulfate adenylyltransferase subunit 1 [Roseateles saccharophilus]